MYQALTEEGFGGLDLRSAINEGGAIDSYNVEVLEQGRLRTRWGTANYTSSPGAAAYSFVHVVSGTGRVLANRAGTLEVLTSGTSSATTSAATHTRAVDFGTPTETATYIADGTNPVRKLVTTTFTSGAALATVDGVAAQPMPEGALVAVTPWDNRLVVANTDSNGGPDGVASSAHHVWFSDPGLPETWDTDNYVQLTPGDGDEIVEMVVWNNQLFVFKNNRLFIFYGTTTDSAGNPIFNYRTVELHTAVVNSYMSPDGSATAKAVAGREGVYFLSDNGIWLTTGGTPVEVSGAIRPIFNNDAWQGPVASFTGGTFTNSVNTACLGWSNGRLFFGHRRAGQSSNDRLFVYDIELDAWMLWGVQCEGISASGALYLTGSTHIKNCLSDYTDDSGSTFASLHRLAFNDYGVFEEKRIREIILEGTGTVNVKVASDWGSLDSGANVTLGTSPAVAETRHRVAYQARQFSVQFGSSGGAWELQRATVDLADTKVPGSKAT